MDQAMNSLLSMLSVGKGGCLQQIYYHREFGHQIRVSSLLSQWGKMATDIAIFNAGAWFHTDNDMQMWWHNFTHILSSPKIVEIRRSRNISLVWRTNHPGHVSCVGVTAPTNTTMETFAHYSNKSIDPYNWSGFNRWDRQSIINAELLGMKILDMSMLYGRPDAHPTNGDCLHFCLPGPTDLFSVVLLQMLYNDEV